MTSSSAPEPAVTVIMPVRNDAASLTSAMDAVLAQRYAGPLDTVLGVGPSSDGTEVVAAELAARHGRAISVVANPSGQTAAALNLAAARASGSILVRVDARCVLPPDYISRAVATLRTTGAANVGGVQAAIGTTPFERAVAVAMTSPFGAGDARFRLGGAPGPVDTVYLGVFDRDALEAVGGFDETLVRNQDYELNWRLRDNGRTVWFDPDLQVQYRPRSDLRSLARQYFQYGQWKREVVRRHPRSLRWRQLIPPATALALGASITLQRVEVPFAYAATVLLATLAGTRRLGLREACLLAAIYPTLQLSWGVGFLLGPGVTGSVGGSSARPRGPGAGLRASAVEAQEEAASPYDATRTRTAGSLLDTHTGLS